jgi:hypothetical protein
VAMPDQWRNYVKVLLRSEINAQKNIGLIHPKWNLD